jgi:hypothetical protein
MKALLYRLFSQEALFRVPFELDGLLRVSRVVDEDTKQAPLRNKDPCLLARSVSLFDVDCFTESTFALQRLLNPSSLIHESISHLQTCRLTIVNITTDSCNVSDALRDRQTLNETGEKGEAASQTRSDISRFSILQPYTQWQIHNAEQSLQWHLPSPSPPSTVKDQTTKQPQQ